MLAEALHSAPAKSLSLPGLEAADEEGSWGADFYQITPKPDERVVPKHRYSRFVGTDLDLILRSTGRRALILTGVATNGCVESTARHGFMRDYYIVLVDDCCSCYSRAAHEATLSNITDAYGVVTTAGELGSIWAARSQLQA
jgi:ureidoacrylate peracid hydrolase